MSYPGVETPDLTDEQKRQIDQAIGDLPTETKIALTGWGRKAMNETFDISCPSGQLAKVKKLKFEEILDLGILDNLDMFRAILLAQQNTSESAGAAEIKMLEGFQDRDRRNKFLGTVNKIVQAGVVEPKITMLNPEELPEGTVYIGDIDYQDKMFLFSVLYQGRVAQLNQFRAGQDDAVGRVAEGTSVPEVPVGDIATPDAPGPTA